jgi:hypothetical protein
MGCKSNNATFGANLRENNYSVDNEGWDAAKNLCVDFFGEIE